MSAADGDLADFADRGCLDCDGTGGTPDEPCEECIVRRPWETPWETV
jgi:hypothetical protein